MLQHWQLWAKTDTGNRWHALPYHLLDVAASAESLWDRLPADSIRMPADVLGDEVVARRVCTFLAAAHDVGKANRFFQAKAQQQYERLESLDVDLPPKPVDDEPRHGQATGAHLKVWLGDRWRWTQSTAAAVALTVGGHHGSFPRDTKTTSLAVDTEPWASLGRSLLDLLADVLGVGSPSEPSPLNGFLGWLAGFVTVADWLGSHESMTIWATGERPPLIYLNEARNRATALLDRLHWQIPPSSEALPLTEILPPKATPKPLQVLAAEIAAEYSLAIVEAPTGEGKTEAAFALTEPARSRGSGVYFALPTMATANGLHRRVETYLSKATGDNGLDTRLLHSLAWLFREDGSTSPNPGEEGIVQQALAQDWFSGPKRALLAPYAVGTVDQALVGALRAKHGFVRLFALAGKTIVIDEVHAYDVYMADLMDVLLSWLRVLGCRVILLSATLPSARRTALLRAWGFEGSPPESPYPSITWISPRGQAHARSFVAQERKPLSLELLPGGLAERWAEGAARVLELVQAHGGLGALILNTVREAQRAFDWLHQNQLKGTHLSLFHARFTARDRDAIEQDVLARFGKGGKRDEPAILVATQVVEQSLDLDFDHMVTALAPIDLLIQRAGRVHRHRRDAHGRLREDSTVDARPNPIVHVLAPQLDSNEVPDLREPMYARDVMLKTYHHLRGQPMVLRESADISDAIEAVYGSITPAGATEAWLEAYAAASNAAADRRSRLRSLASEACIPLANGRVPITFRPAFMDDTEQGEADISARTRLEEMPSVTLILLRPGDPRPEGAFSAADKTHWVLSGIKIPAIGRRLRELLVLPIPDAWRRLGPLRFAHCAELDESGRFATESFLYEYSCDRGLSWRSKNG